jgi:hypothetical protein
VWQTAAEITDYNLQLLFEELATGVRPSFDDPPVVAAADGAADSAANATVTAEAAPDANAGCTPPPPPPELPWPGTVSFLPLGNPNDLGTKAKYHHRFHSVFYDCHSAHLLTAATRELLAPGARVFLEAARYVVDLNPEQKDLFVAKLKEKAAAITGLRQTSLDTADILEFELVSE